MLYYLAFLLIGFMIGSFLNVVICRLEKGRGGILTGRSECPSCGQTLRYYDLIPLLSFLSARGKCRHCKKPISLQYPLVEFFTGFLFLLLYLKFALTPDFFILAALTCFLIILFVYDLKTQMIPDLLVYFGIGISLIYLLTTHYALLASALLAVLVAGGFFAILVYASAEKWMGKGDIKLAILIGIALGFSQTLLALFFAFVLGAIFGLILITLKKKTLKSQIPFGPFLILAFYISLFLGEEILNWYLGVLR